MNCFSHAFRFIDANPYFLVGTSIPDWLGMIDRKTRVRRERALEFVSAEDLSLCELARGIVQHHDDDKWFHASRAFAEMHIAFTQQISHLLVNEARFRPYFVAHVVIEVLIDAALTEMDRGRLDEYYRQVQRVDPIRLEVLLNRLAPRPTSKLARYVPRFVLEGFLYDYQSNAGVAYRINRVLVAIGASPMPVEFEVWLESARGAVRDSMVQLLLPPSGHPPFEIEIPALLPPTANSRSP